MKCRECGSHNCRWVYNHIKGDGDGTVAVIRTNMYECKECGELNVWKIKNVVPKEIKET
jgi:hypothetical protein